MARQLREQRGSGPMTMARAIVLRRSRVLQGNRPSAVVESSDSRFPMRPPYGTSAQFRWKIRVVRGRPAGSGRLGGADAPIAALINKWGFDLAGGG